MKVMGGGRRSTTLLSLLLKKSLLFRFSFPFITFLAHQLPAEVHFVGNLSRIPKLFFLSFIHERLFRGLAYRIFFFFFFLTGFFFFFFFFLPNCRRIWLPLRLPLFQTNWASDSMTSSTCPARGLLTSSIARSLSWRGPRTAKSASLQTGWEPWDLSIVSRETPHPLYEYSLICLKKILYTDFQITYCPTFI